MRFVITGSGRCGTKYMSKLLSAAGVPCGHEKVYDFHPSPRPWDDWEADSSWMAVPRLGEHPTVLLVRHPLKVVKSWMEIGMFGWQLDPGREYNQCHDVLKPYAPWVYEYPAEQDRALASWVALNEGALPYAEMVLRLDTFDEGQFTRLLLWAGQEGDPAVFRRVGPTNRHEGLRLRTAVIHEPVWQGHDPELADRARHLAHLLGVADA